MPSPRSGRRRERLRASASEVTVAEVMDRIRGERCAPTGPELPLAWAWEHGPDQPTVRVGHRADTARAQVGPWIAGALASATVLSTSLVVSHAARPGAPADAAQGTEPAVSDAGNHTVYTPAGVPAAPRIPVPRPPATADSAPHPPLGGDPSATVSGPDGVLPGAGVLPDGAAHDDEDDRASDTGGRRAGGGGRADFAADRGPRGAGSTLARRNDGRDDRPARGPGRCDTPGHILDLSNWKLTLPTGSGSSPTEVVGNALGSLTGQDKWFSVGQGCGVAFRAPVNGVTTSGSKNPRSELREMTDDGAASAGWSSTEGTHTMVLREAFTRLPSGKPQVVGGQIHDASDDISVFRLEGSSLYVTEGNNPHYRLVTDSYRLGTPFEAKYVVSGGVIRAYYNGRLVATIAKDFSGAYFKAGAYTQANCQDASPCGSGNYGEVMVYSLRVTHS